MFARRAAAAALLVLAIAPSVARGDETDAVERDAKALLARASGGAGDAAFTDWKRRLDEAATLILLDQYDEAAFRYYVLVNDPAGQGHPELREAIWWLGESLYLSKDAPAAKPYYET